MAEVPEELRAAADDLKNGEQPGVTVRTLLSWFDAARRRYKVVARVRAALDEVGVITYPDFEGAYIDAPVYFMEKSRLTSTREPRNDHEVSVNESEVKAPDAVTNDAPRADRHPADPAHRLGRLKAANVKPVSVGPCDPIERATTVMLARDFSQLPVMTSDREVKGIISWKTMGSRLVLRRTCPLVKDCMEPHQELRQDHSIFDAIVVITRHDCVLVRDNEKRISGLVTAADISDQFNLLAEPFLLLADIENQIRMLITQRFTRDDLQAAKDPSDAERTIEDASDMTLGEYVRLLENGEMWGKLGIQIDRKTFVKQLDEIREIRNDVMHFDPDGIDDQGLVTLRQFAQFLEQLYRLTSD